MRVYRCLVVLVWLAGCHASERTELNVTGAGGEADGGSELRSGGGQAHDRFFEAAAKLLAEGRETFRFDTFGDEAFWSGTLGLDRAIARVSPNQALAVGLKVDVDALPAALVAALRAGKVDLDDPAVTRRLLKTNAIDDFAARRSPDGRYRTTPLPGLWTHTKGGFYHDGRFATLLDVVNHYDDAMKLGLSMLDKTALVDYLKSI